MPTRLAPRALIPPALFAFLRDLEAHNERAWFEAHKTRYLAEVRDPLIAFVEAFAPELAKISKAYVADPRPNGGSLFRIYRDTRFSKDKRPYKTNAGVQFRHRLGRDAHAPGFYLHLAPGEVFVAGGMWRPDPPATAAVRSGIATRSTAWRRAVAKTLATPGMELGGESLKRPPQGFDPAHPLIEDLKRKDFIASVTLDERAATRPDFLAQVAGICRGLSPLMRFLTHALAIES